MIFLVIRTLFTYLLIILLMAICGPIMLAMLLLPERYRYTNKIYLFFADIFYKGVMRAGFLPIYIIGQENIPQAPAIIVANHQSSLDIPMVGSLLNKHPHLWFVLSYYARMPFLGFFVRRMGVTVDTSNPILAARSLIQLMRKAQRYNCHIIIYPEGGRFTDGQIHDFFYGFAILAKKTNFPVVPIYMPHNYKIYPPGSFLIHPYPLKAIVGPALLYTQHETDEQFVERVRNWFLTAKEEHDRTCLDLRTR
jgi:1-acyl-sn-glycerol-3-phosphate acyltransferase